MDKHNNCTYHFNLGCTEQVLGPIENYYTIGEIDELLENIVSGDIDLSRYVTKDELDSETELIWQDINTFQEELNTLSESLDGYATEEWVEGQNYVTHIKTVNGESLIGDGNVVISGGEAIDAYTKEESDARYGSKEEQESLRNDVEEALGESAKNEADLQKKADKEELDKYALKTEVPKIWSGSQSEYDGITNKDSNTVYLVW